MNTRRNEETLWLTQDGFDWLQARVDHIRTYGLAELRPLMWERERDERIVAAFEALVAEADEIDRVLAVATVLPGGRGDGTVRLGDRVLISSPDISPTWVRPVHPAEAYADQERISCESPVGEAILGRTAGDRVTIHSPAGSWECVIVEIHAYGDSSSPALSSAGH